MKYLLCILSLTLISDVPFLNEEQFNKQLNKNVVTVVEFYTDWNSVNSINEISKLKNCEVFRVNIDEQISLQQKYNIIVVPTVVVFKLGEEVKRYQANLMFQMCPKSFSCKKVQRYINDEIMENYFR